jgi:hypothetical protein
MHMMFTLLFHAYSTICSYSPYFFIPWLLFASCMLKFTIMPVAVIRSVSSLASEKGQSRKFFAQLDSLQECSGPQF